MSSSINALNGSGKSLQFEEFARLAGKSSNVVRFLGSADAPTVHEVSVTKSDRVGNTWFRSDRVKKRGIRALIADIEDGDIPGVVQHVEMEMA